MAWNEPGDNQEDKKKDPWGESSKKNSKPKDLDDALNQLQKKFSGMMRKKSSQEGGSNFFGGFIGIGIIIIALLIIWFVTGFFVTQPPEKAVVLRFGKYTETLGPGLHWIPRFIDSEQRVNVQKISHYTYPASDNALMLTKDQNIVAISINVQYKIQNPRNFLFNVVNPIDSMQQATAGALRQVVGNMNLSEILTTGREALRQRVQTVLKQTLQKYNSGIEVVNVLLQAAQPPEAVKAAFDDAVKAQEDEKRYINQAQAYVMKVVPIAKGQAKRIIEVAKAYQKQIVFAAQANVSPFLAILPEYQKAPEVTRERMYLDMMQNVLNKSSKILVDSAGGTNNLLYLPLEKLLSQNTKSSTAAGSDEKVENHQSMIPQAPLNDSQSSVISRPSRDGANFGYGNLGGQQ